MACIFYYKPCCENHIPTGTKKHGIAGWIFSVWFERFRERKYPWRYSGGGICGHECRAMDFKRQRSEEYSSDLCLALCVYTFISHMNRFRLYGQL